MGNSGSEEVDYEYGVHHATISQIVRGKVWM
jgi:hypothetical protein